MKNSSDEGEYCFSIHLEIFKDPRGVRSVLVPDDLERIKKSVTRSIQVYTRAELRPSRIRLLLSLYIYYYF